MNRSLRAPIDSAGQRIVRAGDRDTKRTSARRTVAILARTMSRITHQAGSSSWRPSANFADVGAA
jgi:hypothetical protein